MVNRLSLFFIGLFVAFICLCATLLQLQLPENQSLTTLFQHSESLDILLIQSYILPRLSIALLAGGILGFASLLLQQVMNNPLASDNTLGISAGSQFALCLTAIFLPDLAIGTSVIALLGAGLSLLLVLTLAMRKRISPLLLILAGLVVNLYFGSFSTLIMLFFPEESRGLALWSAGSLVQESWRDCYYLALQAVPCFIFIAMLQRPLSTLSLNESNAQSLGVPVARLRLIGVLISAYLIACVVSAVGMLGFIGLASATLVRQLGVRTLKYQLLCATLTGALLLCVTDLLLQFLTYFSGINLPTGAVTALLGTPLLLWLMFRALLTGRLTDQQEIISRTFKPSYYGILGIALILMIVISLTLGKHYASGWIWLEFSNLHQPIFELRLPRILVALSVGILLAIAGVLLQRLTLNPMASPELLGVSSGTCMGILLVLFLLPSANTTLFWLVGVLGALFALFVLMGINQRNGMLPEKILLTGISLSALFDSLQRIAIASGNPKALQLITLTSGSTQQAELVYALPLLLVTLVLLAISLLFSRWLTLLGLQAPMAQALGLNITRTRWIIILFSALLTALATLLIGPLSFIGLLVPHISRFLGATKPQQQIISSALLGGLIMLFADWLGRQILFPNEVPAGLVATLIGGSYFLLMIRKV
ncbi:Fe(3+)-hydroxamate ABC transporter permease FhuB [Ursidibacter arcticus]